MQVFQLNLLNWGCKIIIFFKIYKIFFPICTCMCIKNPGKRILKLGSVYKCDSRVSVIWIFIFFIGLLQLCDSWVTLLCPSQQKAEVERLLGSPAGWHGPELTADSREARFALCKRCCIVLSPKIASPNRKRECDGVKHANWRNVVSCWASFTLHRFEPRLLISKPSAILTRWGTLSGLSFHVQALICELHHLGWRSHRPQLSALAGVDYRGSWTCGLCFLRSCCLQPYVDSCLRKYPRLL